jgi:hypothetical protein
MPGFSEIHRDVIPPSLPQPPADPQRPLRWVIAAAAFVIVAFVAALIIFPAGTFPGSTDREPAPAGSPDLGQSTPGQSSPDQSSPDQSLPEQPLTGSESEDDSGDATGPGRTSPDAPLDGGGDPSPPGTDGRDPNGSQDDGADPDPVSESAAIAARVAKVLRSEVAVAYPDLASVVEQLAVSFDTDKGTPSVWPSELPTLTGSAVVSSVFDGRSLVLSAASGASYAQLLREVTEGFEMAGVVPVVTAARTVWHATGQNNGVTVSVVVRDRSPFASPADPQDPAPELLRTIEIVVVYDDPLFTPPGGTPSP